MTEVSYSTSGRIAHFHSPRAGELVELVNEALGIEDAADLLEIGAIYRNLERAVPGAQAATGDYLRVHLHPKRYALREIPILHRDENFVVVDKPAGLPVPSTVDNLHENVANGVSRQLGVPVYVTHRLDTPTSGLLLLATTTAFQTRFNHWLRERKIEKEYRAIVKHPVAPGSLVHYMKPDRYAPKVVSTEANEGWQRCELTVLNCEAVAEGHELTIRLETGRTHQIRVQLAALGNPILGDTLYDGTGGVPDRIALTATRLTLPSPGLTWSLLPKR